MAEPCCRICELSGYRSCDICDGPVFVAVLPGQPELCGYCIDAARSA